MNPLDVVVSRAKRNDPRAPLHLLAPPRYGLTGMRTRCRRVDAVRPNRPLDTYRRCAGCARELRADVDAGRRPATDLDWWLGRPTPPATPPAVDLMAALKASLEEAGCRLPSRPSPVPVCLLRREWRGLGFYLIAPNCPICHGAGGHGYMNPDGTGGWESCPCLQDPAGTPEPDWTGQAPF